VNFLFTFLLYAKSFAYLSANLMGFIFYGLVRRFRLDVNPEIRDWALSFDDPDGLSSPAIPQNSL